MRLNIVSAGTGAHWVMAGVRAFFRQPFALTGLFFLFIASVSLVALVPLIGGVLALVLVPATTVGFMAATREVETGRFPMPLTLFVALRQGPAHTRTMLVLGVYYAVAVLAVLGVSALIDGGQLAALYVGGGGLTPELMTDDRVRNALWVSTLLYLPVSLAFWHAPALVHWHAVPPLKSLFFSLVAVLKNTRAFLVYGVLWLALSFGAGLALLLIVLLLSSNTDGAVATAALVPISLLIAAMFFSSLWFTFRDSFHTEDELSMPMTL